MPASRKRNRSVSPSASFLSSRHITESTGSTAERLKAQDIGIRTVPISDVTIWDLRPGFPDDPAFEDWLHRLDTLTEAHHQFAGGEHVSGPAADTYRHRVQHGTRFGGRVVRTARVTRTLLANPDLKFFPGHGMTCVLDPRRAERSVRSVTDSHAADMPDLSGAVIYVEANSPSIAQGRRHILPDDTVYFERDK